MHTYTRHLGDYAKDTRQLSLTEHGAYNVLMDWCYSTERALPADEKMLFRLCSAFTKEEQQAVLSVINQFFQQTPDGWVQKRIEQELIKAHEKRGKAKDAALLRWNANAMQTHSERNANAEQTLCLSDANAMPRTRALRNPVSLSLSIPPNPRSRGKSGKLTEPVFAEDVSEDHRQALTRWFHYKRELRKSYTPSGWDALVKQQLAFPAAVVAASVQTSMASNWAGLFTDKVANPASSQPGFGSQKKEGGAAVAIVDPEWDWVAAHEELWETAPSCRWAELPASARFDLRQFYEQKKGKGGAGHA
jgi:uncharacterized protein YdaU (DUF1376 family)